MTRLYSIALIATLILVISACNNSSEITLSRRYATADSLFRAKNYDKAIAEAMEISNASRKDGLYNLAGRAEDLIADIISETYSGTDVVSHRSQAAADYLKAGNTRSHRYAMIDVAVAHANADNSPRARYLLDSLSRCLPVDSQFVAACLRTNALIAAYHKNTIDLFNFVRTLKKSYSRYFPQTAYDYVCIALSEFSTSDKMLQAAREAADDRLSLDAVDFATKRITFIKSNFDRYKSYTDSISAAALPPQNPSEILLAQRNFFNDRADSEQKRSDNLTTALIFSFIIFILLIVGLTIYHRLKIRLKNNEIDSKMEAIEQLSADLSTEISENNTGKAEIERLFRERWQTINLLCNEFFEKSDSEKTRTSIVNEIEKELDLMRTPRKLRQIETLTDSYMGGIVTRLREQCTFISDDDITFLTLIYAGFSPRAVCIFTGIKLKYFYTKRSRLAARILASSAPDRLEFASRLTAN